MLTPHENKVAIEFFRDYTFTSNVSKTLHPDAFKSKTKKTKNVGSVSIPFAKWNGLGYADSIKKQIKKENKKGTKYLQIVYSYRLNLNPVYEEFLKKGAILNLKEKKELNIFFDNPIIRNFIIDWNNLKNQDKYVEDIYETISIFIRSIEWYDFEELIAGSFGASQLDKYKEMGELRDEFALKIFTDSENLQEKDFGKAKYIGFLCSKLNKAYKYYPELVDHENYKCQLKKYH